MIGVLGAGAFGTALAVSLASNEDVRIWARSPKAAADMLATRRAAKLPGVTLPPRVTPTADVSDLARCDVILLAVPMQALRETLLAHGRVLPGVPLVACCKGIELTSGLGPLDVIADILPSAHSALLTGPSFASDIAQGLPTALTLATQNGTDLQTRLSTPVLRIYRTDDTIGASLGGALKNVMAIACGAAIGAGLGPSARAALMTRGYAEMLRYAIEHGAQAETLAGLSGLGDLVLTCTSEESRNFRLGLAIGQGSGFDPSITVEGVATARAVAGAAQNLGIDMPITRGVVALIDKTHTLADVMDTLLTRPLKEE